MKRNKGKQQRVSMLVLKSDNLSQQEIEEFRRQWINTYKNERSCSQPIIASLPKETSVELIHSRSPKRNRFLISPKIRS